MLDFKLNYYFEKYKDYPIPQVKEFREKFIKENGKFTYFRELVIMIQKYQIKKYGAIIDGKTGASLDNEVVYRRNKHRYYTRFGNKEEREKRKIEQKFKEVKYEKYSA